jgi:phage baseplate assembly protein W
MIAVAQAILARCFVPPICVLIAFPALHSSIWSPRVAMKVRIADENAQAEQLISPAAPDNSGIGINYADAYIKPLNIQLADGPRIVCQRKGLKIILSISEKSGEAVMRRVDHGPDVRNMLRRALETAAQAADARFSVEDGGMFLDL